MASSASASDADTDPPKFDIAAAPRPAVHRGANTPTGIEHGFDIAAAPGVKTGSEPLRVALKLEGDLQPHLADDGQALALPMLTGQILTEYLTRLRQDGEFEAIIAFDEWPQSLPK